MNETPEPTKQPSGVIVALAMVALRFIDTGLAPWLLVAIFVLGTEWSLTRNLNSTDSLKFLSQLLSRTGFNWFGWFVALAELPLFAWALTRQRKRHNQKEKLWESDANKARDMLKKAKQGELKLTG